MKRYRYGLFFNGDSWGFCVIPLFCRTAPGSQRTGIGAHRHYSLQRRRYVYQFNLPYSGNRSKKYEKTEGIRMILDVMDAKEDQNTQNSQVDRFLALGCDVICVNMVDRSAASVIIDKAMDRRSR